MASYNTFGRSASPVNVGMPDPRAAASPRHQPPPRASFVNFGSLSGLFDSTLSNPASYVQTHELHVRSVNSAYDDLDDGNADLDEPSAKQPLIQIGSDDSSLPLNSSQPSDDGSNFKDDQSPFRKQLVVGLMYGVINAVILVPVLISFAQIIFRDPYYQESMPYLIKLVILSSSVHQMIFSSTSTLPFAIGQVQDAGLIFLSSMASKIVKHGTANNLNHDEILSTTLCWLAISTASLGLALYITGKLKLASLVQYLPLSVVAGYLAFIGLYCFEAGLSLMSGREILGPLDWGKLFNGESMLLMCPGLLLGVALVFITGRFRHFAVLPCCLVAIPIVFHLVLLAAGVSLDEARAAYSTGWLASTTGETHFWQVWEHYQFSKVDWSVIPTLLPTWVSMYFVVAFSSSLDVAAIQMELGRALDFNHELSTVGISNLVSGLTGGFTGSYIFSQTLFTMRANIESRIVGIIVICLELLIFTLPISILAFVPKFFFGSVLTFIAIDLIMSWLVLSYTLVHPWEYAIIWLTFIAICFTNLEEGMAIGVALSILGFILQYASAKATQRIHRSSNVQRGFAQRSNLAHHRSNIITFKLSGYIFFGSSLSILKEVKEALNIVTPALGTSQSTINLIANSDTERKFLILDLSRVSGIDATAVRTCFLALRQLCVQHDHVMLFSSLSEANERILRRQSVLADDTYVSSIDSLDEALEWAEDAVLRLYTDKSDIEGERGRNLQSVLTTFLLDDPSYDDELRDQLLDATPYFKQRVYQPLETIFDINDESDSIYFVESGEVILAKERETTVASRSRSVRNILRFGRRSAANLTPAPAQASEQRIMRCCAGGSFGEMNFALRQPRQFKATATQRTVLYEIDRLSLDDLSIAAPAAGAMVNRVLMKSLALLLSNNLDSIVD